MEAHADGSGSSGEAPDPLASFDVAFDDPDDGVWTRDFGYDNYEWFKWTRYVGGGGAWVVVSDLGGGTLDVDWEREWLDWTVP